LTLLLDEMYSVRLAEALRAADVDVCTVVELGLAGSSDPEVFAAAIADGRALLTENVADFARISADHVSAGQHHPGVLIALSSRFSRRAAGIEPLATAVRDIAEQQLTDRLVYLQAPSKTDLRLAHRSSLRH
jgi:predicted nuclease of predicted toxin-antitoxin system